MTGKCHAKRGCRAAGGFTLLDLLVTVLLVSMLMPLVCGVCSLAGASVSDLSDRAQTVLEANLTLDTLARDLGRASSVTADSDSLDLLVWNPPPVESLSHIGYSRDDEDRLWREDFETGRRTVVSPGVTSLNMLSLGPSMVRVELVFRENDTERAMVLVAETP